MRLIDAYSVLDAPAILYRLLAEREPHVNISHRQMPSPAEHMEFFCARPYERWALIQVDGQYIGAAYLTKQREIGIFIFRDHQRKGYGTRAIVLLMELWAGRLLANIAPTNPASVAFFEKLGFRELQITYVLDQSGL